MHFVSLTFIAFFAVVVLAYRRLELRGQNRLLLVASYVFYGAWDWRFLGLIVGSSLVDYACGRRVDQALSPQATARQRKAAVAVSVTVNLGLLAVFKYFGFFVDSLRALAGQIGWSVDGPVVEIVLPVGISFYTFQTLSYTIDIYRGQVHAARRLDDYLVFVAFFPQLVAGPIERARHLLPQIEQPRVVRADQLSSGALLALVGFAKKMVVADNLSPYVESIYRQDSPAGAALWLATYAFALQIYADFSGYTDIARGTARMLGIDLCRNFRTPYFATNPSDFWARWHISLSSWLRDYLYIPLGGSRGAGWQTARNLFLTMLLGGLWHGAAWHFVWWGAYHGVLLTLFHRVLSRRDARAVAHTVRGGPAFWLKVVGFFQLTCLGWLIFRIPDASALPAWIGTLLQPTGWADLAPAAVWQLVALGVPLMVVDWIRYRRDDPEPWTALPAAPKAALIVALFYAIVLLGTPHAAQFIYFQF